MDFFWGGGWSLSLGFSLGRAGGSNEGIGKDSRGSRRIVGVVLFPKP